MAESRPAIYDHFPKLGQLRDEVLFGDVWEQPDLSKRDRSLITIAVLTALYRTDELRGHIRRALNNGVTKDEIRGMVTHLAFYAGWPTAVNAARVAWRYLKRVKRNAPRTKQDVPTELRSPQPFSKSFYILSLSFERRGDFSRSAAGKALVMPQQLQQRQLLGLGLYGLPTKGLTKGCQPGAKGVRAFYQLRQGFGFLLRQPNRFGHSFGRLLGFYISTHEFSPSRSFTRLELVQRLRRVTVFLPLQLWYTHRPDEVSISLLSGPLASVL